MEQVELTYTDEQAGERLDQFISRMVGELTRSSVQRLIEEKSITVNGAFCKPGQKLKGGEKIIVNIPPPQPVEAKGEKIPLDVLHEDSDVVVVNKPAGMVVHPGAGNATGTLVNALLGHCSDLSGIGGELRPGIVHRIDKDTTGILIIAKNDRAHASLAEQFKEHTIKRIYLALVYGTLRADKGKIDQAIGRHPVDRKRMSGKAKRGKAAVTHWQVIARYEGLSLIKLRLETGRTHQIRVHLSEAGHPLVGDPVYGSSGRAAVIKDQKVLQLIKSMGRQALHATTLGFLHPADGRYMEFSTGLPEDMSLLVDYLEGKKKELNDEDEKSR